MNKKIFVLVALILLITGCNNKYTLTISDKGIEENIDVNIPKAEIPKQTEKEIEFGIELDDPITPFINNDQYPLFENRDVVYKKEVVEKDDAINVNLNYFYTPSEYANSNALKKCFDNYGYSYQNGYYIKASGKFYCLYSNELEISIKVKNKVIRHNADSVENNVYTWHINRDNVDNVDIEIKIEKSKNIISVVIYALAAIIIIITLILIFKFNNKRRNANEF